MAELKEVFEMVTNKTEPDLDSWKDQEQRQRRTVRNKKIGAFAVAAAIGVAAVGLILGTRGEESTTTPGVEPPTVNPAAPETGTVGTVTFDGSTCSMEITVDRIEPGVVVFDVVNAADQRVMFDSWQILDGYTFRAFETAIERVRRLAEAGKPYPSQEGPFPDQETEVRYLGSEVIAANSSGIIVTTMSSGPHGIACLTRFEGAHRSLRGFQTFGLAGSIVVG
jgi:hypothetical protein